MKKYSFVAAVVLGCFLGTLISNLLITPQIAMGATAPKPGVIKASRFELVDNNGNKRASLEMEDEDKTAALYLWDSNGKQLVLLKASPDGSSLIMKIKDKPALGFAVQNNQGAMGFMNDTKTGKPGLQLTANERGGLIIIYKDGVPRGVKTDE